MAKKVLKIDDTAVPDQFQALVDSVERSLGGLCSISVSHGREPASFILVDAVERARKKRKEALDLDQRPIVADLRNAGFDVSSLAHR